MAMRSGVIAACDEDRSLPAIRRSRGSQARSIDALERGFWSSGERRKWGFHGDNKDDLPHPTTIPDAGFVGVNRDARSSRRFRQPASAEFLGFTDEFIPRQWTAHSDHPHIPANHSWYHGNLYLEANSYFHCFDGNSYDEEYLDWELMVDEFFYCNDIPLKLQARIVASKLIGRAKIWWKHINRARHIEGRKYIQTWAKMKRFLRSQFLSLYKDVFAYVSEEKGSSSLREEQVDVDLMDEGVQDVDDPLSPGEVVAEIKPLVGELVEVDKGVENSLVLVSISIEEFQPVEDDKHHMEVYDGSDGDQKRGVVLDVEGMVIDGKLGSGKRQDEVGALGGKFLEMELGGKYPDVDLKFASKRIVVDKWGSNNGQACLSLDYNISTKSFAPKLVDALKVSIEKFYGDNPLHSEGISCVVNSNHFVRLGRLLNDEKVSGAIIHGEKNDEKLLKIAPTLLLDVPHDSLIMPEEIFGPLLSIITYENLEECFDLISSKSKPLAAFLFSRNKKFEDKFVKTIFVGGILIDETTWSKVNTNERSTCPRKWYDLLLAHTDALALLITLEQGKPLEAALGKVSIGASFIDFFAEEAKRVYGDIILPTINDRQLLVLKHPIGVVGAITPWNFPLAMITRKTGPALASGCTMVVKPSEFTPLIALAAAELVLQVGIPPGALNVVLGNVSEIGDALLESMQVGKITFAGSTNTVKRVSLELGGNAPSIVFDDADIDVAVKEIFAAKFRNSGQTGASANRILVQEGIHEKFVNAFSEAVICELGRWVNGELVVARGVLDLTTGLRWEPMVMWRLLAVCSCALWKLPWPSFAS